MTAGLIRGYIFLPQIGHKAIAVTGADASVPERELKGADASVPERELKEAEAFCKERGIRHFIRKVDPLKEEGYRHNSPDRCYFCKHGIFSEVKLIAEENGIAYMAEGSNMDDVGDYRPGLRAAAELSVKSLLMHVLRQDLFTEKRSRKKSCIKSIRLSNS